MKNDKYLRARGGETRMIDVSCAVCGSKILFYQKDGPSGGWLKRCYINRIFGTKKWENLQHDASIKTVSDLPNLTCDCGNLMGVPMIHKDGRLAYRLIRGSFTRRRSAKTES